MVIVVIVFGAFITAGGLSKAIDPMSFIFVAGIGVGHALCKVRRVQLPVLEMAVSVADGWDYLLA